MRRYTIYCTEEQTRKALKLGAPIFSVKNAFTSKDIPHFNIGNEKDWVLYIIPTAEQMIGWLEEQGLLVSILYGYEVSDKWAYDIDGEEYFDYKSGEYNSRKEATLAAIDAALEYLQKKGA